MSKWMKLLEEETEKSKSIANQQLSVLSVPFEGLSEKNDGVLDRKIENPCFEPMSVLSVPFGGILEKKEERKSVINQQLSVLSVPYREISFKFYNIIENIYNNPYIRTDNTDIGSFPGINYQAIDFPASFADAIEIIATRNRPKEIRESRWIAIVKRLNVLVHDEKHHLLKMIDYGWPPEEVFGCHKFAPDARIDGMGLLMLLSNSTIAEVHPEKALLTSKSGSTMSYYLGVMNRNMSERSTLMEIE